MEPLLSNRDTQQWKRGKWPWRWRLVVGIAPALLLLAIGLSFFKQCTALGRAADTDIADPQENGAGGGSKAA